MNSKLVFNMCLTILLSCSVLRPLAAAKPVLPVVPVSQDQEETPFFSVVDVCKEAVRTEPLRSLLINGAKKTALELFWWSAFLEGVAEKQCAAEAQFRMAKTYAKREDLQEARYWYQQAAEQGHTAAQEALATLNIVG